MVTNTIDPKYIRTLEHKARLYDLRQEWDRARLNVRIAIDESQKARKALHEAEIDYLTFQSQGALP